MTASEDQARLTDLYDAHAARIYAYCLRQVGTHEADDVLSETFAVTCRRLHRVPDDPLPWLIAVARNVCRNWRRKQQRDRSVLDRLRDVPLTAEDAGTLVAERDTVLASLARLSAKEREALLLVAWEGLTAEQAARASGCSLRAFRARVTRARARLDRPAPTDRDQTVPIREAEELR